MPQRQFYSRCVCHFEWRKKHPSVLCFKVARQRDDKWLKRMNALKKFKKNEMR